MHMPSGNSMAKVLIEGLFRIAGPLALGLVMFLLGLGVSAEKRLDHIEQSQAAVEASRFTARDGMELRADMSNHVTREELDARFAIILEELRLLRAER